MVHTAIRVTIIAERLLEARITEIIEKNGATGYTILDGSGKGRRGTHLSKGAHVVNAFSILKIELIVLERETALAIAQEIEQSCFEHYSGIVYLTPVEILRKDRF